MSIVGLFASVNYNTSKKEGEPVKKESIIKTDILKPEKVLNACSDELQALIAKCYGVDPTDVCCITVGGSYTIISTMYVGSLSISSCGTGCTHFSTLVNGTTPCSFDLPYTWPC